MQENPGCGTFSPIPADALAETVGAQRPSIVSQCLNIKADLTAAAAVVSDSGDSGSEPRQLGAAVAVALTQSFRIDDHPLRVPKMTPGDTTSVSWLYAVIVLPDGFYAWFRFADAVCLCFTRLPILRTCAQGVC